MSMLGSDTEGLDRINGSISTEGSQQGHLRLFVIFFIVSIALALFVIASNVLFLIACWKHPSLRTISTMYVHSLAVADIIQGLSLCFQGAYFINSTTKIIHSVKFLCLTTTAITSTGLTSSLMAVMLIAMDRYVYIVHPYSYPRLINVRRTQFVLCAVWTLSIVYGGLPLYYNQFRKEDGCTAKTNFPQYAMSRLVMFLSASIITGFCHVSIQYTAFVQIRRIHPRIVQYNGPALDIESSTMSSSLRRSQLQRTQAPFDHLTATMRLVKTFLLIYVFFFCSWFPGVVVYVVGSNSKSLLSGLAVLAQLNAGLNVYVYVISNKQFKEAIRNLIHCKRRDAANSF